MKDPCAKDITDTCTWRVNFDYFSFFQDVLISCVCVSMQVRSNNYLSPHRYGVFGWESRLQSSMWGGERSGKKKVSSKLPPVSKQSPSRTSSLVIHSVMKPRSELPLPLTKNVMSPNSGDTDNLQLYDIMRSH